MSATFADLPKISIPKEARSYRFRSGQHLYIIEFDLEGLGYTRLDVIEKLREHNVSTQFHYIPVYRQPFHSG
ncbi:DegT/DnrJ/EryC1/StrS family aminotransferase [Kiloniella antarctica]|uniref:DegT/DnrJ/EryC1/StrS family aminotransferase n=1 Tax=Kiloniella antarctica TaxID=1550907 RepID=A0ABW5BL67_9PROT